VVWVAALLAAILSLPRLFANDHADGTLEQMLLSAEPLTLIVLGKAVAHWLVTGLLYLDTTKPNLMSLYNLVDTPLNRLTEADLRPAPAMLDTINGLMF